MSVPQALHRFLMGTGRALPEVEALVAAGRVGYGRQGEEVATVPDGAWQTLVFEGDVVTLDGGVVRCRPWPQPRVWASYKPRRVLAESGPGRVLGGVGDAMAAAGGMAEPVQPIGRLDKDTTGLLLFTACGVTQWFLLLPGQVPKAYLAGLLAPAGRGPTDEQMELLTGGGVDVARQGCPPQVVTLEEAALACAPVPSPYDKEATPHEHRRLLYTLRCVLRSGQNHVVKRVLNAAKLPPVRTLHRERIGGLMLDSLRLPGGAPLQPGDFVELTREQCLEAGVPTQPEVDALAKCRLLCRHRAAVRQGQGDARLEAWLAEHHTLQGECYDGFPGLKCRRSGPGGSCRG